MEPNIKDKGSKRKKNKEDSFQRKHVVTWEKDKKGNKEKKKKGKEKILTQEKVRHGLHVAWPLPFQHDLRGRFFGLREVSEMNRRWRGETRGGGALSKLLGKWCLIAEERGRIPVFVVPTRKVCLGVLLDEGRRCVERRGRESDIPNGRPFIYHCNRIHL